MYDLMMNFGLVFAIVTDRVNVFETTKTVTEGGSSIFQENEKKVS